MLVAVFVALITVGVWLWWLDSQVAPEVLENPDVVIELPPPEPQTYVSAAGVVVTAVPDPVTKSLLLMSEVDGEVVLAEIPGTDGTQFGARENTLTVELVNDVLRLTRSGQLAFEGELVPADKVGNVLGDTSWYWQELQLASGELIVAREPERFALIFNTDNTLSVGTDCNQQGGPYEVNNNNLLIGSFYATKMYCADAQESVYVDALQRVVTYMVADDTLRLYQADGSVLTFSRSPVAE